MAKTRREKEQTVATLTKKLVAMKAVVFVGYAGLTVKEATQLRSMLRGQEVEYIVAKKALLRRALAETAFDQSIVDQLTGEVALAVGYSDEVMPAKLLYTFGKDHQAIQLIGGLVNGQYLGASDVTALARLPSRQELLTKTVWVINGPLTGLVNVLAGNLRGLITILTALKDRQPAAA